MKAHMIFIGEIVCTATETIDERLISSVDDYKKSLKDYFENGDFAHNLELRAASDLVKVCVYQKFAQCAFEDENNG